MKNIDVENRLMDGSNPCFVVAEIGVNHNGSIELAKRLISAAKEAGSDAVKFQTWKTENIILKNVEMAEYQKKNTKSNQSQYEMLKKLEISYEKHFELKEFAEDLGLVFFSTMEDKESVDFLINELKIPLIKVGSGDLTNYPLLKYTAKFGIPMVLSTGMATLSEIDEAVRTVSKEGNKDLILLQCTSNYPCPYEDMNLRAITSLKHAFKFPVGLSDHSLRIECAIAAVALGGKYIEKHFTLSHDLPGPDHKASLEPFEFKRMVEAVRNIEIALGD
ncbi:MAG: N-acetylneuraminate synthase family protein, partial [Methanosarcinaceae archaeon]|nr:N-acetylneuraminate synthase family protein [Methanosarcinaceae archaeon]